MVLEYVISSRFNGCFRTIVFAILDNIEEKIKVKAFRDIFGQAGENDG